ncbi:hypothetical protein OS31_47030 [Dickeya oryzae]
MISAYERFPLAVSGDGTRTIQQLLADAQQALSLHGRPNSEINSDDPRIDLKLTQLGLQRETVLPFGQKIFLLDNANLSTGGTSSDITSNIHDSFAALAINATASLGLRVAGVDIICRNLCQDAAAQQWNIIEINAAPGLDNYAASGYEQRERVKDLYRRILLQIQRENSMPY